jgi:flagellar motility protein MotE (MotC chaperone)
MEMATRQKAKRKQQKQADEEAEHAPASSSAAGRTVKRKKSSSSGQRQQQQREEMAEASVAEGSVAGTVGPLEDEAALPSIEELVSSAACAIYLTLSSRCCHMILAKMG